MNLGSYTDKKVWDKVIELGGYIPKDDTATIIGIQSKEDITNKFDDAFVVYSGKNRLIVSSGTTNAGATIQNTFKEHGLSGAAVWKTNTFYKGLFEPGLHRGKMKALRQEKPIYYYRDSNKNGKCEEEGKLYHSIIYANMHGVDYDEKSTKIKEYINGWSWACQVWNNMRDYYEMIDVVWNIGKPVNYALLKEF
jgi:hypothetical protein